jgi:5-methylcytosine-specific restriction endonuclease McrBC regulatory subunit McrC
MNVLFEKFVTKAFITMGRKLPGMRLTIGWQDSSLLSQPGSIYKLKVKPDITLRAAEKLVWIVDAEYKRAAGAYENHDFLPGNFLRFNPIPTKLMISLMIRDS